MKKGPNSDGNTLTKASSLDSEKKSEYAYADPYQLDKWSLQAIARGKVGKDEESAYASVDSDYQEVRLGDPTYAEVGKIKPFCSTFDWCSIMTSAVILIVKTILR